MKNVIKQMFAGLSSKSIAWFAIVFGIVTIILTWIFFLSHMYFSAMFISLIGNLHTWATYSELNRRKREDG